MKGRVNQRVQHYEISLRNIAGIIEQNQQINAIGIEI